MTRFLFVLGAVLLFTFNLFAQTGLFKEVSDAVGINYTFPGTDAQMAGGGVIIIDVNNDGWEDVFQAGGIFDSKLWLNEKGVFKDKTEVFGLNSLKGYFIQGAACADYDNDGFQDFFIANFGKGAGTGDKRSPVILKNIQGTHFEVIKLDSILKPEFYSSACWGDINNDGYSDLYITNYVASMGNDRDENGVAIGYKPICYKNKLLINQAGKGFVEMSVEYGVDDLGCGFAASFTDVDMDGDMDLLLLNDFGHWSNIGNKYFRNDFPLKQFTDISAESGFDRKMYGMGIGQGDYDQDGDIDYYVTNIGDNSLYNNDHGAFTDVANTLNIQAEFVKDSVRGTSWSGLFMDYEFDGDLDLYISKGNVMTLFPVTAVKDPNLFYINDQGKFIDTSSTSNVNDFLSHRGSAIFDFDHDGDLDIISSVVKMPWGAFSEQDQKIKLFQNQSEAGNFVGIKLIGKNGVNSDCFGCRILFEQDELKMMKEVDGGSGQTSQSSRILYYGIGTAKTLQKATVFWTDGTSTILSNIRAGIIYTLENKGTLKKSKIKLKN